jgi:hypothetical protein
MSGVILAVSLRAGNGPVRSITKYDVTRPQPLPDGPNGPSAMCRRLAANRQPGEHVHIAVTCDGTPYGDWTTRSGAWPRESAAAIRRARQDLQETA